MGAVSRCYSKGLKPRITLPKEKFVFKLMDSLPFIVKYLCKRIFVTQIKVSLQK